mgnify:CR=1 FL=1
MLGYSGGLAISLLGKANFEGFTVVGVSEDVSSNTFFNIVSEELPYAWLPVSLTVMVSTGDLTTRHAPVSITPFAVQRPQFVRGGSFIPNDAVFLLAPESWYFTAPREGFTVPVGVPVVIPMPSLYLGRYYGLGAQVAHSTGTDLTVSLIWGLLYGESE